MCAGIPMRAPRAAPALRGARAEEHEAGRCPYCSLRSQVSDFADKDNAATTVEETLATRKTGSAGARNDWQTEPVHCLIIPRIEPLFTFNMLILLQNSFISPATRGPWKYSLENANMAAYL